MGSICSDPAGFEFFGNTTKGIHLVVASTLIPSPEFVGFGGLLCPCIHTDAHSFLKNEVHS